MSPTPTGTRRLFIAVASCLLALSGCSSPPNAGASPSAPDASLADASTGDAGIAPLPISLADYCKGLAAQRFRWLAMCQRFYTEDRRDDFLSEDTERCLAVSSSIDAGRVAFDGVAAARCLQVASAREDCAPKVFPGPGCEGVLRGRVPNRGACVLGPSGLDRGQDCATGFCDQKSPGCPTVCRAFVAEGGDCTGNRPCAEGLYADGAAGGLGESCTCKRLEAKGDACTNVASCEEGYLCRGTCLPRAKPGDACSDANVCEDSLCLDGVCAAKSPRNGTCYHDDDCWEPDVCFKESGWAGHCRAPLAVGSACKQDGECASGACADGNCISLPGPGEPCSAYEGRCAEGYCKQLAASDPGECTKLSGEGEPCANRTQCVAGLLCMGDGKCHAKGTLGAPCLATDPHSCTQGSWCTLDTQTCHEPAALDEPCNVYAPSCTAGLRCVAGTDTGDPPPGTCQPAPPKLEDGAPCTEALPPNGGASDECKSGLCINGKCTAPVCD